MMNESRDKTALKRIRRFACAGLATVFIFMIAPAATLSSARSTTIPVNGGSVVRPARTTTPRSVSDLRYSKWPWTFAASSAVGPSTMPPRAGSRKMMNSLLMRAMITAARVGSAV